MVYTGALFCYLNSGGISIFLVEYVGYLYFTCMYENSDS